MELTKILIESMSYVDFISLLRETNRCPGGKNSIRKIMQQSFVDRSSKVLEIGSNTGFTSLEIARTAKCSVVGIDVVESAVAESRRMLAADTQEIQGLVRFEIGSALEIPFTNDSFDLVVTGGATSFMDDKCTALQEYYRVMKPWGFLSVTNLYYEYEPPASVIEAVSRIIGVQIKPWRYEQWMDLFKDNGIFEPYYVERNFLGAQESSKVDAYVESFMAKDHLLKLPDDVREAIKKRWLNTIEVFNENHRYLGFLLALFRKRPIAEELEFFTVGGSR